jgi:MFS family permease
MFYKNHREVMKLNELQNDPVFLVLFFIMLVFFVLFIAVGVFANIAIVKLAKKDGYEHAGKWIWGSFISCITIVGILFYAFVFSYYMGELVRYKIGEHSGWKILGIAAACGIIANIPIIQFIGMIGSSVFFGFIYYWLFKRYIEERDAIIYAVLSSVIPFAAPFLLFSIRNKEEIKTEEEKVE